MTVSRFDQGVVIPIDKPVGMTSFEVVRRIRRWTGVKKAGHGGTLDPLASGLLLVLTGEATKQFGVLLGYEKSYESEVVLGIQTTTDDAEGEVIASSTVPDFSRDALLSVLSSFGGTQMQTPPRYAALKKGGKPLYHYARRGVEVEIAPRPVVIHAIELLAWEKPVMRLRIRCGSGVYIRALARDIGDRLGTGGFLQALRRTRIGPYRVEEAFTLETFSKMIEVYADPSAHR